MSTASSALATPLGPHYDRIVRGLVEEHRTRKDEPLVLAVRYRCDEPEDIYLLEVIGNFPGNDDDPLFETAFGPSADLVILGELHLALASPAQLRVAVERGDKLVEQLRKDGEVIFPAKATGAARALLKLLGIR